LERTDNNLDELDSEMSPRWHDSDEHINIVNLGIGVDIYIYIYI